MRHFAAAFLALCFCLLAACAGMEGGRPAVPVQPETPPPETPPVEPEYQLDAATAENTFTAEDGTEVAHYTMGRSCPGRLRRRLSGMWIFLMRRWPC